MTINNYYKDGPLQDRYEKLRRSLLYARMGARERNITTALPDTCNWLFKHTKFNGWTDWCHVASHHGFLWIKGKPGSGKSTIMKAALAWAQKAFPSETTVSYFFNARAPEQLEKSSLGLYRSLVFQLLVAQKQLRPWFVVMFEAKIICEQTASFDEWTQVELQGFLTQCIETRRIEPLNIFVDALDEGDEDDIRGMIGYFEDLAQLAVASGVRVRICLSSRHYPHITVQRGFSLVLEDQAAHDRDIELYVEQKLRGHRSRQMEEIRKEILRKASGIFLWVVLVIPILNRAYDYGGGAEVITTKLKSIPEGLHDLFTEILSRSDEKIDECVLLFRWLLYSKVPLTPQELYAILQFSNLEVVFMERGNDAVDQDLLQRRLLSCSRGLVELTKGSMPIAQFIHESVRDYLKEEMGLTKQSSSQCQPAMNPSSFAIKHCHAAVAETCIRYLLACSKALAFSNPALTVWTVRRELHEDDARAKVLEEFPLLKYTARYWWEHVYCSEDANAEAIADLSICLLEDKHFSYWVIYCRPLYNDCWIHRQQASPLYYAALLGLPHVVARILAASTDFNNSFLNNPYELYFNNPLHAAHYSKFDELLPVLKNGVDEKTFEGWERPLRSVKYRAGV